MVDEKVPYIVLADGTVLENCTCSYAEHMLWCMAHNMTINEAFAVFSNPEKTRILKYVYGTYEKVYEGFTELNVIKVSEFTVDIRLIRPEVNNK